MTTARLTIGALLFAALALLQPPTVGAHRQAAPAKSGFLESAAAALKQLKDRDPLLLTNKELSDLSSLAAEKLVAAKAELKKEGWMLKGGVSFEPHELINLSAEIQETEKGIAVSGGIDTGISRPIVDFNAPSQISGAGAGGKFVANSADRSLGFEFSGGIVKTIQGKLYQVRVERIVTVEQIYENDEKFLRAIPPVNDKTLSGGITRDIVDVVTGVKPIESLGAGQPTNPVDAIVAKFRVGNDHLLDYQKSRVSQGYRLTLQTPDGIPVQGSSSVSYTIQKEQDKNAPPESAKVTSSIGRSYDFKSGVGVNVGISKDETFEGNNEFHRRLFNIVARNDADGLAEIVKGELIPIVYREEIQKALDILKQYGKAMNGLNLRHLVANGVVVNYNPDLLTSGEPPAEIARALKSLAQNYRPEGNSFMVEVGPLQRPLTTLSLKKLLEEKSARTVGNLTRLRGYILDPSGDILLVGESRSDRPKIDIDVLVTAARSILGGADFALVSLDPDPDDLEGPHRVRIEGLPEDLRHTEFTRIMIEADYRMKQINHGDADPQVPGFKSWYRILSEGNKRGEGYSRFWLMPYQSGAADIWEYDKEGREAILFDSRVLVMTERMKKIGNFLRQTGEQDPAGEESSDLFTRYYNEIAESEDIFCQLNALFDAVKLCAIWKNRNVKQHPLIREMLGRSVKPAAIRDAYPGLKRKNVLSPEGTPIIQISGGATAKVKLSERSFLKNDALRGLLNVKAEQRFLLALPATATLTPDELRFQSADIQLGLGLEHLLELRYDEAISALDQTLALDASLTAARVYRGLALLSVGKTREALEDIEKAASEETSLCGLRAYLKSAKGDTKGAAEDAASAEGAFPDNEEVLFWCAMARVQIFDLPGADRIMRRVVNMCPTDNVSRNLLDQIVLFNKMGQEKARKRIELLGKVAVPVIDGYTLSFQAVQSFDFDEAVAKADACLQWIERLGPSSSPPEIAMKERCLFVQTLALGMQSKMIAAIDPDKAAAASERAQRTADELINLHPSWPIGYLLKASMSEENEEAMENAVKLFEDAFSHRDAADPLLDDIRTLIGADNSVAWFGLTIWYKIPDKSSELATRVIDKVIAVLGESVGARLLKGLKNANPGTLPELRKLHKELPETLNDPGPIDLWCIGIFYNTLVKFESQYGDPKEAIAEANKYLRVSNVEGLNYAILLQTAAFRFTVMTAYILGYRVSFADDPRIFKLRAEFANGNIDPSRVRKILDEVEKDLLAKASRETSKSAAGFIAFFTVGPQKQKAESDLKTLADQYFKIDANEEERSRLEPVLQKWREELDLKDPKSGNGEFAVDSFDRLIEGAETTAEIHTVKFFADVMLKTMAAMAQSDPETAARMERAINKSLPALAAKHVKPAHKQVSWEGWPQLPVPVGARSDGFPTSAPAKGEDGNGGATSGGWTILAVAVAAFGALVVALRLRRRAA